MHIPTLLTMIEELIAIPSVSCVNPEFDQSNQTIIELLASWCDNLGFTTEILPVPDHAGKFNLLATLGHGAQGLVLAGHTDTVPYDEHYWHSNPFQLTEVDNRLYGLGTADMKSFFALALTAVSQFKPNILHRPLTLIATADEESGMYGARALVKADRPKDQYVVIGEPTQLRPVRMHKGIFTEAIQVKGISGHSSYPDKGNSALEGMYKIIGELLAWRTELQTRHTNPLFDVPTPTMNLGYIHGGDNPNRICETCELHLDLRLLPGMSVTECRHSLRQRVLNAIVDTGLQVTFTPLFEGFEAMETPADAEIIQVAERLSGQQAVIAPYATEAPYFQALGNQTVVLGPGNVAQAHQPNEFITKDFLQPALDIFTQLIQYFCVRH
jgi:acetylornithine deacetylase